MLCTHCGEPLKREDRQCPLCGADTAAALPSGGPGADKEPAFIRRMRFERPAEEDPDRPPPSEPPAGADTAPERDAAPKARRRRSRTAPPPGEAAQAKPVKAAPPPLDGPPEPTFAPVAPPEPVPAPVVVAPPVTAKPGALGESPLEEVPEEARQQTSEELKRVLQTVFATSRHREPPAPKPARPHGPPPIPPLAEKPRAPRIPALTPPQGPRVPSPPAAAPPAPQAEKADDWSLGDAPPPAATRRPEPLPPAGFVPPEPVAEVEAPPASPEREQRRLGPDLADYWSLGAPKSAPRSRPDDDDFFTDDADDAHDAGEVQTRRQPDILFHDAPEDAGDAGDAGDTNDPPESIWERQRSRGREALKRLFNRAERQAMDGEDEEDGEEPPEAEAPQEEYREEVEEIRITVAGVARRAVAGLADRAVSLLLVFVLLSAGLHALPAELLAPLEGGPGLAIRLMLHYPALFGVALALWVFVDLLMVLGCTLATGQTPGKMLFDLRVIQADGEPLTAPCSLLRAAGLVVGGLLLFLGPLWAVVDPHKQGFHDKLAGTYVIRAGSGPDAGG